MTDKRKPEQPPDPARRKFLTSLFPNRQTAGELGAELGKLNRDLHEISRDLAQAGQEMHNALADAAPGASSVPPTPPDAPPADPQIADLLAQVAALTAVVSTFAEQSATDQAQTRQLLENLANTLTSAQAQQTHLEQSPHTEDQEAAKQLDKKLALLIAAVSAVLTRLVERTAEALYDGWVQENLLPLLPEWVQRPWTAFARGEQPISPLSSPLPQPESPAPPPDSSLRAADPRTSRSTAIDAALAELVRVPAGWFLMGRDKRKDPRAWDDETPQHWVWLDEFWIAKYPITNAQYAAFVLATGHHTPYGWQDGAIPHGKERHPVRGVDWYDAGAYCDWLSSSSGRKFRLPNEAEWEKAARGTDGRIWPWGDDPPDAARCNFNRNVDDTTPVGAYPRGVSPFGALDMAGNVWEWTRSLWGEDFSKPTYGYPYLADDGRENLAAGRTTCRVLRGGSYDVGAGYVRCAFRGGLSPFNRDGGIAFGWWRPHLPLASDPLDSDPLILCRCYCACTAAHVSASPGVWGRSPQRASK